MGPKEVFKGKFKDTVVNVRQAQRREQAVGGADYGLPPDLQERCPVLATELENFMLFMTEPNPYSQDSPIRKTTADVYLRHARLFLGWLLSTGRFEDEKRASITDAFPCKDRSGVKSLFDFVQFLRKTRDVSVSYEANMLRGLIKLAKYRFASESDTDTSYGGKSYEDIPLIREARKLHRDANRRQTTAPRVSDEKMKWLSWPEYLAVVQAVKEELQAAQAKFAVTYGPDSGFDEFVESRVEHHSRSKRIGSAASIGRAKALMSLSVQAPMDLDWKRVVRGDKTRAAPLFPSDMDFVEVNAVATKCLESAPTAKPRPKANPKEGSRRAVARLFQHYLVLALFSCIPDRQRTFRELEIGRNFVKEEGRWLIRHGPEDYKTGKSYGARPPLMVALELVPLIDIFIEEYRSSLCPKGNHLFVQRGTGKPMTQDSIYQIVARSCFNHTGKKTNPHLLRDMIVTHVRETDASEKQLEALALYMGHSINMQRSSYDRRTLNQKVAPAVDLLRVINEASS
jgi:integrase